MTRDEAMRLRLGDEVRVAFGGFGEQQAVVVGLVHQGDPTVTVKVRKWRQRSRTWTGPVAVTAAAIRRVAPLGEVPRQQLHA